MRGLEEAAQLSIRHHARIDKASSKARYLGEPLVIPDRLACGAGDNAFKIPLARRAVVRALETAVRGTATVEVEDRP